MAEQIRYKYEKHIKYLDRYPADGNHEQCYVRGLPFEITRGADEFYYKVKGVEKVYNSEKRNKIDARWIAFPLDEYPSLNDIEIKCHKDLEKIVQYCIKEYLKALKRETKRIKEKGDYFKLLKEKDDE